MEFPEKFFGGDPEIVAERSLESHFIQILMEAFQVGVLAGLVDKEGDELGAKVVGDPGPRAIRDVLDILPVPEVLQGVELASHYLPQVTLADPGLPGIEQLRHVFGTTFAPPGVLLTETFPLCFIPAVDVSMLIDMEIFMQHDGPVILLIRTRELS